MNYVLWFFVVVIACGLISEIFTWISNNPGISFLFSVLIVILISYYMHINDIKQKRKDDDERLKKILDANFSKISDDTIGVENDIDISKKNVDINNDSVDTKQINFDKKSKNTDSKHEKIKKK